MRIQIRHTSINLLKYVYRLNKILIIKIQKISLYTQHQKYVNNDYNLFIFVNGFVAKDK